jgi:hypothetical protein
VDRCSLGCRHIVVWVGLFPTYNLCDNTTQKKKEFHLKLESATPCVSFRIEAETEACSRVIVISGGSQRNSQNSRNKTINQSQSTSPKVSTTPNTMAGVDHTLRMPDF